VRIGDHSSGSRKTTVTLAAQTSQPQLSALWKRPTREHGRRQRRARRATYRVRSKSKTKNGAVPKRPSEVSPTASPGRVWNVLQQESGRADRADLSRRPFLASCGPSLPRRSLRRHGDRSLPGVRSAAPALASSLNK
jgi:hypothetical protein